jgi:MFS family permease
MARLLRFVRDVPRDARLIYAAAFFRALANGLVGVLLAIYLAELSLSPAQIGLAASAGLAGATLALLAVTLAGDRLGRRRVLFAVNLLGALFGALLAIARSPAIVAVAAFLGMVNAMGRDRGASLVIEQAILPGIVRDDRRTRAFAVYNLLQDAGHALGGLLAAAPALLRQATGVATLTSMRATIGLYAALFLAPALLAARLTPAVEPARRAARAPVSPETRSRLWRISSLFALDSLAGGLLTTALLSYFFFERYGVSPGVLGLLFFGARTANALSHLGAAWLARRIGLVNTMVFTHIPSSLLLLTIPIVPSFPIAAALFLLREGLVEMDVPTRQSYVMAIVRPEERTFASGVTNLVRTAAWAVGPVVAGVFMQELSIAAPLIAGSIMKIAYDLMLYRAFRGVSPPEEATVRNRAESTPQNPD